MLAREIATADYLDIIFDNRNKQYGAYELRKGYYARLRASLLITTFIVVCALTLYYMGIAVNQPVYRQVIDVQTNLIDLTVEPPPPPLVPPPPPPAKQMATVKNLVPLIVKDEDVKPEDQPPIQDELETSKIGDINQAGEEDDHISAPPVTDKRGIIESPIRKDETPPVFIRVEVESEYPGGPNAWRRFLIKTLDYPALAQQNGVEGSVVVRFVVDAEGNVSRLEAISGPEELRQEAIRVISKSGKWIPAIQNGRKVSSYKNQVIVFRLEE